MALEIDEQEFRDRLKKVVSPSVPISTPELLLGREKNLEIISRAFNNPGRHVFVYGDRGVGKTSLAHTAAFVEQSSDSDPILVGCDDNTTFSSLARDIFKSCLPTSSIFAETTETKKVAGKLNFMSAEAIKGIKRGIIPQVDSVNEAVDVTKYISEFHSKEPVVVIDEFDQIVDDHERKLFAQFLKQLSDRNVPIKFIICGIGGSVEALLGAHISTDRLLTPIELKRLPMDAIWKVLLDAAGHFGIEVPKVMYTRIAQICDGFPYYIHLITENLLWAAWDAEQVIERIGDAEYHSGITGAIQSSSNALKGAYEKAIRKYNDDREEVLWSFADSEWLDVQVSDAWARYQSIMEKRSGRDAISRRTFDNRVQGMKTGGDSILVPKGNGWYHFRENVTRGYVRLRAEKAGIKLGPDHI